MKQMSKKEMVFKNQVGQGRQGCAQLRWRGEIPQEPGVGRWDSKTGWLMGMNEEIGGLMNLEFPDLGTDYKHHKHHKLTVAG
jgi:hypothetical protein